MRVGINDQEAASSRKGPEPDNRLSGHRFDCQMPGMAAAIASARHGLLTVSGTIVPPNQLGIALAGAGRSRAPISFGNCKRGIGLQRLYSEHEAAARRGARLLGRVCALVAVPRDLRRLQLVAILLNARGAQPGEAVAIDRQLPGKKFLDR